MAQLTFVTGWFRRHGIAYLDMILGALEGADACRVLEKPVKPGDVLVSHKDQYEIANSVGYGESVGGKRLKSLDRVVVLFPSPKSKGRAIARPEDFTSGEKWERVCASVARTNPDAGLLLEKLKSKLIADKEFPPLKWFETEWKEHERLMWHVINEAPLDIQAAWYQKYSPLYLANKERIHFEYLDADDVDIPESVTSAMYKWLESNGNGDRMLVNLYGTTTTVQFGWYYLAWRMPALKQATFLRCLDDKTLSDGRFAPITIDVVGKDPIGGIKLPRPEKWASEARRNAEGWLNFYLSLNDNFSILLLGERGTGKSEAVEKAWKYTKRPGEVVIANCANFCGSTLARSELFGHVKGAFTGAAEDKIGLLEKASEGLLFLDEVHHLDYETRSMLLTALQTDASGSFSFTKLGASEQISVKFQPVFASNCSKEDLGKKLESDFLDRITQRVLRWPEIKDDELEGAWNEVWRRMDFQPADLKNPISDDLFLPWLKKQKRPGNFRDLQRIAILCADYIRARPTNKKEQVLIPAEMMLQQFLEERYWHQDSPRYDESQDEAKSSVKGEECPGIFIPADLGADDMTEDSYLNLCRSKFAEAVIMRFGTGAAAATALRARGSKITAPKLSKWMNLSRKEKMTQPVE